MRALLIKAFRGQFVVEALVRFRSLLILPIATRLLGPTGYGWIAFAAAVTGLVGAVATLGMPAAIARFLPGKETDDERAAMFWPAFAACALTVAAFAGLTIAAFAFGHLAPKGIPFGLVVLAAANVVSNELKLFLYGFWRYNVELTPYYRFMMADAVLVAIGQVTVLVVLHRGALAVVAATIVVDGLLLTVALASLARRLHWHPPSRTVLMRLYRFGLPLVVTSLLVWANNTADRFFVQGYRGSAAVGVYSVGYNLGTVAVAIVGTPMVTVLSSLMFRAWDRGDREEAERLPRICATILILTSLPAILSLGFFGQPFVTLLAGAKFSAAEDYVVLVAVGYLMLHLTTLFGYLLWLHNRQYLYSLSMVVSVGVNIVGNAVLVPRYGAFGSAIATTASLGLLAIALVVWNLRAGYSRPPVAVPLATAATALVCWFVAALAWPSSPTVVDTAVYSAVTTVAFLAVAFVLRLIPKELRSALLRRRIAV